MLEILWADLIAYMILQTVIVNRSWGAFRIIAALPLAIMIPMLALTVVFPGHQANPWLLGLLLFLGINFRTNLIFFSAQPDCAAAFFAAVGLYLWIARGGSWARSILAIGFFLCAMLLKQTSAAFALIRGRALRTNYPLSELSAANSLEEKNQRLHDWLKAKLSSKEMRFYGEATFLFDE